MKKVLELRNVSVETDDEWETVTVRNRNSGENFCCCYPTRDLVREMAADFLQETHRLETYMPLNDESFNEWFMDHTPWNIAFAVANGESLSFTSNGGSRSGRFCMDHPWFGFDETGKMLSFYNNYSLDRWLEGIFNREQFFQWLDKLPEFRKEDRNAKKD